MTNKCIGEIELPIDASIRLLFDGRFIVLKSRDPAHRIQVDLALDREETVKLINALTSGLEVMDEATGRQL